jgi:transcriptional regulator with XRE-family HTH domain
MITGHQIRMARTALRLGVRDVAARARVSPATVSRIESGSAANVTTLDAIRKVLQEAGVTFFNDGNDQEVFLTRTGSCCSDLIKIARSRPTAEATTKAKARIDQFFEDLREWKKANLRDGSEWVDKLHDHLSRRLHERRQESDVLDVSLCYIATRRRKH